MPDVRAQRVERRGVLWEIVGQPKRPSVRNRVREHVRVHQVGAYDPDLMILATGWSLREITPAQVKLVIEIADTSLAKDLGVKAAIYARVATFDQEPENQLQQLRRYCAARGRSDVEYVDRGVSRAKDRRPASINS